MCYSDSEKVSRSEILIMKQTRIIETNVEWHRYTRVRRLIHHLTLFRFVSCARFERFRLRDSGCLPLLLVFVVREDSDVGIIWLWTRLFFIILLWFIWLNLQIQPFAKQRIRSERRSFMQTTTLYLCQGSLFSTVLRLVWLPVGCRTDRHKCRAQMCVKCHLRSNGMPRGLPLLWLLSSPLVAARRLPSCA